MSYLSILDLASWPFCWSKKKLTQTKQIYLTNFKKQVMVKKLNSMKKYF
jgi:hypothetical protein